MQIQRHSVIRGTTVALVTALVVGCAREHEVAATPEIPEINLTARDFSFVLPDTVAGGLVRFHYVNQGQEDHHAQFIRLNDGVSREQFDSVFAAAAEGEVPFRRVFDIGTWAGGPSVTAPGGSMDVTLELAAGEYIVACFIQSPDGVRHLAKGMRRWLTVTAPPAESPEPPVAVGVVDMVDFAFITMPSIDSGRVVLEVTNSGEEPHEMGVMRLEGVTFQQAFAMLAGPPPSEGEAPVGPPPFRFMGGVQAIMPGARAWVTLDLPPGDYALICFLPSPAHEGRAHFTLGMVRPFTVN